MPIDEEMICLYICMFVRQLDLSILFYYFLPTQDSKKKHEFCVYKY